MFINLIIGYHYILISLEDVKNEPANSLIEKSLLINKDCRFLPTPLTIKGDKKVREIARNKLGICGKTKVLS